MSHEQRKFTPPNPDNQAVSLQYAYRLERQAGAVLEAQSNGRLLSTRFVLKTIEQKEEAGERWYIINSYLYLYSGDCDEEVIRNLVPNRHLIVIRGFDSRPDVDFGRERHVIAAVLTKGKRILYKCPEFNLEAYMQEQSLNKEKKDEK